MVEQEVTLLPSLITSKIVRQYALIPGDTNGVLVYPEYNAMVNGSSYSIAELSQMQLATDVAVLVGCWPVQFLCRFCQFSAGRYVMLIFVTRI